VFDKPFDTPTALMPTSSTAPFYIIGTERSGSNLLRVILNAHPDIDVPHPPHILKYFHALEAGYGDLNQDKARRRLLKDVMRLLAVHIYPWGLKIDADAAINQARPGGLFGIFGAIYDQHLAHTKKRRWGCKSTFMVHHIDAALKRDPEAKFIWLVRDPRDVAVSAKKSVFSPFHPLFSAELWDQQQRTALGAIAQHPGAILKVHYEDLIANLKPELEKIMGFLGERLHLDMLEHHRSAAAKKGAGLSESWKNTGAPVVKTNAGKYRSALSARHIALVEHACTETMDTLGYTRDGADTSPPPSILRSFYALQDGWWQLGVELRSAVKDTNHWRRWGRAVLMAGLGWRRGTP
jgi:hypothetical protein